MSVTSLDALKGEGADEPLISEDGSDFLLPENESPITPPAPNPKLPPAPVAFCPGLECCDPNPFAYATPGQSGSLSIDSQCATCYQSSGTTTITATGIGPGLTWSFTGTLPPGLTFHGGYNENGTVVIDGTPTTPGSYSIVVTAVNAYGNSVTATFPLTIFGISTTSIPNYTVNTPYFFQLQATGGSGNYGWAITAGALPDGLVLNPINGIISGTPTGLNSGVQPITFEVFDITCERFNPVFTPQVSLQASSVSYVATVLGYSEFPGQASSPPKKYHTVSWAGSSEQQLWYLGVQIGGARYDFSGTDNIDTNGNVTSNHVKNSSVMCNGASDRAVIVGGISTSSPNYSNAASFLGYFGTNNTFLQPPCLIETTELCGSGSIPYNLVGNIASPTPFTESDADLGGLWGSARMSSTENLNFIGTPALVYFGTVAQSVENGTETVTFSPYAIPLVIPEIFPPVTAGLYFESFSSLITPCGVVPRPPDWNSLASVIYSNDFSAILSNEYTDAEALANAAITNGNSRTATYSPRTSGFTTSFTTVNYGLTCTNLVVGASYTVSWSYIDLSDGTVTPQSETFVATSTTQIINHNIPQPSPGRTLTVTQPTIAFA